MGELGQPIEHRRRHEVDRREQVARQLAGRLGGQRPQKVHHRPARAVSPLGPQRRQCRLRGHAREQRRQLAGQGRQLQRVERGRVGEVRVVDEQDERRVGAAAAQHGRRQPRRAVAQAARRGRELRDVEMLVVDRAAEQRCDRPQRRVGRRQLRRASSQDPGRVGIHGQAEPVVEQGRH